MELSVRIIFFVVALWVCTCRSLETDFCYRKGTTTTTTTRTAAADADSTTIEQTDITSTQTTHNVTISFLEQARKLHFPTVQTTSDGELEHVAWWEQNSLLIRQAWYEWEHTTFMEQSLSFLTSPQHTIHSSLYHAIHKAWRDPVLYEVPLQQLFTSIVPANIYVTQLLSPSGVSQLRAYLDAAAMSGIPMRRPNGMNRYGQILHPADQVDGAISDSTIKQFCHDMVDKYLRPTARSLFPHYAGSTEDDIESYLFTVHYSSDQDLQLKEHSDASLYTININLNLPNETYSGSELQFFVNDENRFHNITLQPGMAVWHLGKTRHRVLPIYDGSRYNLVVWIHGRHGQVRVAPYNSHQRMSPRQRWSQPHSNQLQTTEIPVTFF